MTGINFESVTSDVKKMDKVREDYAAEVQRRRQRTIRLQIVVAFMGVLALLLRVGMQMKVLPMDKPNETLSYKLMSAAHKWYEHPAVLFVMCGLLTPTPLFYYMAAEGKRNSVPFFVDLGDIYCVYLRGMFTTSILVDILQAALKMGQPATLFSALYYCFQGQAWIDPYMRTDKLSFPSYQATISSYIGCFCLMIVNKRLNTRFADKAWFKLLLQVITISIGAPLVGLLSFTCYSVFKDSKSPVFVEFYYASVILGMVIAIFEVQGTMDPEPPLAHYHVIMRRITQGSPLPACVKPFTPLTNDKAGEQLGYIAMECLREYHRPRKLRTTQHGKPTKPTKPAKPAKPAQTTTIQDKGEK